jgi:signal transduction histidine kinase
VVTNLMLTALDALRAGGRLTLGVHREHVERPAEPGSAPGGYVCLTVQAQGEDPDSETHELGFPGALASTLAGARAGLGLSACHWVVREHGGWIEADRQPGEGSTLAVFLPVESDK